MKSQEAQEAFELIERVTATFQGTRQDHINIQAALETLKSLLSSTKKA